MSLFTEWKAKDTRTLFQKWGTKILQNGPLPKHVAIIMDGNRRYSRKKNISVADGYQEGAEKLCEVIRWGKELGIPEVTVYAFSIENFKRSPDEREILFRMLKNQLEEGLEEDELNKTLEHGTQIRFVGDWSLYPADLKPLMAEVMLRTRHQNKFIMNFAFAYTSRNEMARGAELLRQGIAEGDLEAEDVNEQLLNDALQIHPTNPVDILVRTSETYRLSDFMLWQSTEGVLHFLKSEWPEFSFWEFWSAVFKFQRNYEKIQELRGLNASDAKYGDIKKVKAQEAWIQKVRTRHWEQLKEEAQL